MRPFHYATIFTSGENMPLSFTLTDEEKKFLCRQAALAIDTGFADGATKAPPQEPAPDAGALRLNLGSFVTLTQSGSLRGCIGTIVAHEPLWVNVWNMARAAAFSDPRFPPLTKQEWTRCRYEISVLDQPTPCPATDKIVIGRDGLILQWQGRSGVFLPQVPVEQDWNVQEYLLNLCRKAGLPPYSWEKPGAKLFWYQALVFSCQKN